MKDKFFDIFRKFTKLDKVLIVLIITGVIISVVSLSRGILKDSQVQIEYLNSSETGNSEISDKKKIYVDIEGAVESPGVYEMNQNDRIKDVLVKAGGYTNKTDREYCEKNLNLAQLINDGEKIYIPSIGDTPAKEGYVEAKSGDKKVNINTGSIEELDTLWGVGKVRAEVIVKNRPYSSLDDLVKKGSVTNQILEKNRNVLVY